LLHGLVILLIILIGIGPILVSMSAGMVANAFDCTLHEGFVNPCVIGGVDYGETLYSLGVMGWTSLRTCPLSIILLVVYAIAVVVITVIMRNRRTAEEPP
jgi:hypothetical protein